MAYIDDRTLELAMKDWMLAHFREYSRRGDLAIATLNKFNPPASEEPEVWWFAGWIFETGGPDGVPPDETTKWSNPRRKRRKTIAKNPGAKATAAKKIYEKFNGRPARKNSTVRAPNGTPANVAKLGALRLIKTADGRKWAFNGAKAPDLAADHRGRLHVVGGSYRANPAGTDHGEIVQIEYETKKPHLGQPKQTIYYHKLGEEGGRRPKLRIDREGLIRIIGGDYRIEADGIHD